MLTEWLTIITEVICNGLLFPDAALFLSPECSGINSVRALLILALILGFLARLKLPRFCALLVAASALAVAQNVVRVCILVYSDGRMAHSAWELLHNLLGYATALPAIIALFAITDKLKQGQNK